MPSLASPSPEYVALTQGGGLLDRSERGKLALTGPEAKMFLQGQVSNDVESLVPGSGCYAAFLTQKGKMLGDLRILDTGDELLLDTERVALQELFNLLHRFRIGYDLELHKRTLQRGLLSLIGPGAAALCDARELPGAEHSHLVLVIDGVAARAIRTDAGVDLLCEAEDTPPLREALQRRGAVAVTEESAETLRVEGGRPRYGIDLDDTVIPQEAGLNERAVSFTKGCYVGQETVARLHYRGRPNRQLRGLLCAAPAAAGAEITFDGRPVGRVGSTAVSPRLGALALALVRREALPGTTVSIGDAAVPAEIVELPFP